MINFEDLYLTTLCVWRESRSEHSDKTLIGVAYTVKNRAMLGGHFGSRPADVVLKPLQYSSFNHNDPQSNKIPLPSDQQWQRCKNIVVGVLGGTLPDSVQGATHYYDKSLNSNPPIWANTTLGGVHLIDIDDLRFWRCP